MVFTWHATLADIGDTKTQAAGFWWRVSLFAAKIALFNGLAVQLRFSRYDERFQQRFTIERNLNRNFVALDCYMAKRPRNHKLRTLKETDHLCRFCGDGMVMEHIGCGPTGGGNPVFTCVHCGETRCSILGASSLCFCGKEEDDANGSMIHRCFRRSEIDTDPSVLKGWKEVRLIHKLGVLRQCNSSM